MFTPNTDYNYELESNVLGVFLLEPLCFSQCLPLLEVECFYREDHQTVFKAIKTMHTDGWPIDLVTVNHYLVKNGVSKMDDSNTAYFLTMLTFDVVCGAHIEFWCIMLREMAVSRATIELTSGGKRETDPVAAARQYEKGLKKLLEMKVTDDWQDGNQVGTALKSRMAETKETGKKGVTTGIIQIDNANGGFRPGQMVIIAARPAVGKSALMGLIATRIAQSGVRVGIISLEMDNMDIFARIVASESGIPFHQIDRNEFYDAEQARYAMEEISKMGQLPICFSDTAKVTPADIRAKAEKLKRKYPTLGAIMIDYLQLITPEQGKLKNREQEIAEISRNTKLLAKQLGLPIIILAQLNRDAAKGAPQLIHLRESGSLEQDADVVFMLERDTQTEDVTLQGQASLYVRKWRNGQEMKVDLGFDGDKMRFFEKEVVFHQGVSFDKPGTGINRRTDNDLTPF